MYVTSFTPLLSRHANRPVALYILHSLGWVHRDISSGNILIVDDFIKIADLEYAKREDDTSQHGIRTVCHTLKLSIVVAAGLTTYLGHNLLHVCGGRDASVSIDPTTMSISPPPQRTK